MADLSGGTYGFGADQLGGGPNSFGGGGLYGIIQEHRLNVAVADAQKQYEPVAKAIADQIDFGRQAQQRALDAQNAGDQQEYVKQQQAAQQSFLGASSQIFRQRHELAQQYTAQYGPNLGNRIADAVTGPGMQLIRDQATTGAFATQGPYGGLNAAETYAPGLGPVATSQAFRNTGQGTAGFATAGLRETQNVSQQPGGYRYEEGRARAANEGNQALLNRPGGPKETFLLNSAAVQGAGPWASIKNAETRADTQAANEYYAEVGRTMSQLGSLTGPGAVQGPQLQNYSAGRVAQMNSMAQRAGLADRWVVDPSGFPHQLTPQELQQQAQGAPAPQRGNGQLPGSPANQPGAAPDQSQAQTGGPAGPPGAPAMFGTGAFPSPQQSAAQAQQQGQELAQQAPQMQQAGPNPTPATTGSAPGMGPQSVGDFSKLLPAQVTQTLEQGGRVTASTLAAILQAQGLPPDQIRAAIQQIAQKYNRPGTGAAGAGSP
jgi:hypothetical protein